MLGFYYFISFVVKSKNLPIWASESNIFKVKVDFLFNIFYLDFESSNNFY